MYFSDPTAPGASPTKSVKVQDLRGALNPDNVDATFQLWIHPEESQPGGVANGILFYHKQSYGLRLVNGLYQVYVKTHGGPVCSGNSSLPPFPPNTPYTPRNLFCTLTPIPLLLS